MASVTRAIVATAQDYPAKPIRWIVGYPAGGGFDILARSLSQKMTLELGQPFIIDNRPGAAGIIGAEAAARSAPDGYTMVFIGPGELVYNQVFYKKLPYDADKDFTPVGLVAKFPLVLVVNSSVNAKNIGEFIALAKSSPGRLSYASGGLGHPNHLAMELLKQRAGIDLVNVPYRGMPPAIQDVVAGSIPAMFLDLASGTTQVKAGKVRMLAVSTRERLALWPELPTLAESGIANYEYFPWGGLAFPAGTPAAAVRRMNEALAKSLRSPDLVKRFGEAGIELVASTPEQLAELIQDDRKKWHPLIRSLGISLD